MPPGIIYCFTTGHLLFLGVMEASVVVYISGHELIYLVNEIMYFYLFVN